MNICPECGEECDYLSIHIKKVHKISYAVYEKTHDIKLDECCKECGEKLKSPALYNRNGMYCCTNCNAIGAPESKAAEIVCKECGKHIYASTARYASDLLLHHAKVIHHYDDQKEAFDKVKADENAGQCKYCGRPTKFQGFTPGYRLYCSRGCSLREKAEAHSKLFTEEELKEKKREMNRKAKAAYDARQRAKRLKEQEEKLEYKEKVEENITENYDQSIKWVGRGREESLIDFQQFGTVTEWC